MSASDPKKQLAQGARRHTKARFIERFGKKLSDDEYDDAVSKIQSNTIEPVIEENIVRSFYPIEMGGEDYFVLYDNIVETIITVYIPKWLYKDDQGEWHKYMRLKAKHRRKLHKEITYNIKYF